MAAVTQQTGCVGRELGTGHTWYSSWLVSSHRMRGDLARGVVGLRKETNLKSTECGTHPSRRQSGRMPMPQLAVVESMHREHAQQ